MSIEIPDDDPVRQYGPEELVRLTQNLFALLTRVHRGEFSPRRFSIELMAELHGALFEGVRDHAGQHRRAGQGSERLQFGPFASMEREKVPRALQELAIEFEQGCDRAEMLRGTERTLAAIRHAAMTHAKFIKIHPYEDGNGRVGRVLMSIVLVRLGLAPIAIETPKQEYLEALNHHHRTGDIQPLQDLLIRLAATA